jgi:hypothetical protein
MVQPKNRYSYFRRLQSELGFDAEEFVTDPTSQEYKKARQAMSQQPPDPIVTAEQVKQQAQLQGKQIDSRDKALDRQQEFALGLRRWSSKATWTLPRPESVQRSLSVEERLRRAAEAEQLLSNSLLQEAFSSLEADIVRQMYQVRLDDDCGAHATGARTANGPRGRQVLVARGARRRECESGTHLRGRRID